MPGIVELFCPKEEWRMLINSRSFALLVLMPKQAGKFIIIIDQIAKCLHVTQLITEQLSIVDANTEKKNESD